ncbi:MAG: helix-turn-helix transcriptional regulator [Rhodospirillales bacterium]|nr:helix-turn-helix transcriptional regulator [Rhodospirillales bacterium]
MGVRAVRGQVTDRRSGGDRRDTSDRRHKFDRRSGFERRRTLSDKIQTGFAHRNAGIASYDERRAGKDRRKGDDSRLGLDRRSGIERRIGVDWRETGIGKELSPEQAVDLVSDFYGASMDPRFWPTALMKLCEATGASACALAWHDFTLGNGGLEQSIGIDVESVRSYGEYYCTLNPWLQSEDPFMTLGTAWADADLVDDESILTSEFVLHWLQPQGLNHQMFGVLERQGNRVLYLTLARPASQGAFNNDAVGLLQRLLPYLQRGLRAGQMLRRTQNIRQAALDALDVMPIGVILLSAGGVVIAANRVAREIMAARDVLTVGRGGLEVNRDGRRVRFRDLVADTATANDNNRPPELVAFSVSRSASLRPLSLMIWPTRDQDQGLDAPAAVVFLGDPDRSPDVDETRLRQLYGLTAAEARVAALLARGYRLDEIAEMLGVAYETTRKHLKKVLSKMQTDRQAELVRSLVTGPGGLC